MKLDFELKMPLNGGYQGIALGLNSDLFLTVPKPSPLSRLPSVLGTRVWTGAGTPTPTVLPWRQRAEFLPPCSCVAWEGHLHCGNCSFAARAKRTLLDVYLPYLGACYK